MAEDKSTEAAGTQDSDREEPPVEIEGPVIDPSTAAQPEASFPRDPEDPTGQEQVAATPTESGRKKRFAIGGWLEKHTKRAVSRMYESRADEIEERARRAVGSAYRDQADDIQDRAIHAMRIAIAEEADRIKEAIEHGVEVKKREVRLSLLVLVIASLVYLLLYWFTQKGGAPS